MDGSPALSEPLLHRRAAAKKKRRHDGGLLAEGSTLTSAVLLCSAAIGAGVLALPYGVSLVGVMPALALFALAGLASSVSNVIICRCVQQTQQGTYGKLMTGVLGKSGVMVLDAFIFVEGLAAVAAYLIFVGDYVPQICAIGGPDVWCTRRTPVILAASLVVWPLSCLKGLAALRHVSTCSIATVLMTSLVVVTKAPGLFSSLDRSFSGALFEVRGGGGIFQVLSMACFAFMTHTNTPEIALEMRMPTRQKFNRVVCVQAGLLWVAYAAIGICGFLSFLDEIDQDFLTNYEVRDFAVVVCRLFLSVTLIFACPINLMPSIQALFNVVEAAVRPLHDAQLYNETFVRVPVTTACFSVSLGIALRTPHVADLIGTIGTFGSAPLMFAFPARMYWKILGGRSFVVVGGLVSLTLALWLAETVRLMS